MVTGDRGDAGCERSGGHMVAVHTEQEEQRSGTLSVVRAGRKRRVESQVTLCKVKGGGSVGMEEVKGLLDIRRVMRSHCRWDLRNRIREVV